MSTDPQGSGKDHPQAPETQRPDEAPEIFDFGGAIEAARRPALKALKLFLVGTMFLATLAAGVLISGVIEEREARQASVLAEFRQSWGPEQAVNGPVLVVPYLTAPDKPRQYLKIAPARLKATARLAPEDRKRGMFHATVYAAAVELEGAFAIPPEARLDELIAASSKAFWSESFIMLETSGLAGVAASDGITVGGQETPWRNCWEILGEEGDCQQTAAVIAHPHFDAPPTGGKEIAFKAMLNLRGTGAFRLVFQGKELEAVIAAPWGTPSFTGTVLPKSSMVAADRFEARWQALAYAAPQMWTARRLAEAAAPGAVTVGVSLIEAAPTYRMIHRASKYDILFVVLAFTVYFLFEILTGTRIHVVQYAMLGASLTLFGLLLVSFSEAVGYENGYALSSALVLAQASLFTATVARRALHAVLFAGGLAALFGFLYVLLSLETYSLMVGSVGLFAVLSLVMIFTRKVDWSGEEPGNQDRENEQALNAAAGEV